ncbi:Ff.00g035490.m01.CDS01 [Fusarium sp. VM40]|nr:Ff.00g035490.m01.CDS01 [Fusarium sp. VM40]
MIPSYILSGTIVLLATGLASAGPCHPSSIASSSAISVIETSLQSSETQTATEAITTREASSIASADTTQTDATTTELSIATTTVETTTGMTSDPATTAAATTTTTVAEPLPSVKLIAVGSSDPSLSVSGGLGFSEIGTVTEDMEAINFSANPASTLVFTISELTGQVKVGNGPSEGKSAFYIKANIDYSAVFIVDDAYGRDNGFTPVNCRAVNANGYQSFQCKYNDVEDAEFWTCASRLILVKPGVDFTQRCPNASTSYKIPIIQVIDV